MNFDLANKNKILANSNRINEDYVAWGNASSIACFNASILKLTNDNMTGSINGSIMGTITMMP